MGKMSWLYKSFHVYLFTWSLSLGLREQKGKSGVLRGDLFLLLKTLTLNAD